MNFAHAEPHPRPGHHGYDAIGDFDQAQSLARFLDRLDQTDQLAKTIVYNSNPAFNSVFATIAGCFQDATTPGKMQWGSAWWFLDQLDGMEAQIRTLANMGLLSQFVGMITDSRSFLSWPRHDYFRRLLCRILGDEVRRGRLPDDPEALGMLVADVSFHNARNYFGFALGDTAVNPKEAGGLTPRSDFLSNFDRLIPPAELWTCVSSKYFSGSSNTARSPARRKNSTFRQAPSASSSRISPPD